MIDQIKYQDVCKLTDQALVSKPVKEFFDGELGTVYEQAAVGNLLNALCTLRSFYKGDQ